MSESKNASIEKTEQIARENKAETSNGNVTSQSSGKPGGAEKGGPGQERAADRQPPQADFEDPSEAPQIVERH